jgi:hypothetical protein
VTSDFTEGYVAICVLAAFQTLIAVVLLSEIRRLTLAAGQPWLRRGHLSRGTDAPNPSGFVLGTDKRVDLSAMAGEAVALVFVSPECPACQHLIEGLRVETSVPAVIICCGDEGECQDLGVRVCSHRVIAVSSTGEAWKIYGVTRFPTAVLLDREHKILGYFHPRDVKALRNIFAQEDLGRIDLGSSTVNDWFVGRQHPRDEI